ncbi:MAG TPA: hypothetical protein VF384_20240 [Planctomycetota bacterium]
MQCAPLALLVLSSLLAELAGQVPGSWVALPLTPRPFARERHAMVFDVARNRTVLFGGFNGAYMNDTWELGPSGWSQRSPAASPSARADHAMAYDPVRQRTVLIGGTNGSPVTDIWEWDGSNWTQRATGVTGLDAGGSASYDPLQGGVFYNLSAINLLWNGTSANTVNVAQPMGSSGCGMVFHAAAGGVLLKEGQQTKRFTQPQGWVTLGSENTFGVNSYGIAQDPVRNRVFIQSGIGYVGSGSSQGVGYTWQWAGAGVWQQMTGPQPILYRHCMVFDFGRDTFVMFGGHLNGGSFVDTTYVWTEPPFAASYATYGSGCAGTLPLPPRLRANPLWISAPILGSQFIAEVDQIPAGSLVGGVMGLSATVWASVPLPLALGAFGMPGCNLLASMDATLLVGVANANGSVNWVTAIPATPSLAGFPFFQQAFVLAPGANPAGILMSNGGHAVVGN